ncbi:hypothetical protein EQW79_004475 [Cellulosimicrobium terreum]|uniref:Uncharacterized protein n=1 Tax=Cellulosimicrobium funkei TaxID=264251 RepID=A0A4Y8R4K4_9MICO|nr:hypothetical protein E1O70_07020 [Cellulosimicrobium funkei]TGA77264.1 hypothetical protein EQW79_004475 [Cellulosimicrobium terreum]
MRHRARSGKKVPEVASQTETSAFSSCGRPTGRRRTTDDETDHARHPALRPLAHRGAHRPALGARERPRRAPRAPRDDPALPVGGRARRRRPAPRAALARGGRGAPVDRRLTAVA